MSTFDNSDLCRKLTPAHAAHFTAQTGATTLALIHPPTAGKLTTQEQRHDAYTTSRAACCVERMPSQKPKVVRSPLGPDITTRTKISFVDLFNIHMNIRSTFGVNNHF